MRFRVSLAGLMALVSVLALGLAAMREASAIWLRAAYTVTVTLLVLALLGSLVKTRPRSAWIGFALFGWASFCVAEVPAAEFLGLELLDLGIVEVIAHRMHRPPAVPSGLAVPSAWDLTPQQLTDWIATDPLAVASQMKQNAQMTSQPLPAAVERYLSQHYRYQERLSNSRRIGVLLRCLILALAGAVAGILLAPRDPKRGQPEAPGDERRS